MKVRTLLSILWFPVIAIGWSLFMHALQFLFGIASGPSVLRGGEATALLYLVADYPLAFAVYFVIASVLSAALLLTGHRLKMARARKTYNTAAGPDRAPAAGSR